MKQLLVVGLLATNLFAGETCLAGDLKEPSKISLGIGFSNFNTYSVGNFSIENDDYNNHSQGMTAIAGYEFFENENDTWTIDGEVRLGQSYWNYPLDTFSADMLAKATYYYGYVGVYALGGISYSEFSDIDITTPAVGLGLKGLVTDNASVFIDYLGKPINTWHEEIDNFVDSGVVTVGVSYRF